MKQNLHPTYFPQANIVCACGTKWNSGSTNESILSEICSNCHPFYTGKQKLIDTTGNVDRFTKRVKAAADTQSVVKPKKERKVRTVKVSGLK